MRIAVCVIATLLFGLALATTFARSFDPQSGKPMLTTLCAAVVLAGVLDAPARALAGLCPFPAALLWPVLLGFAAYLAMALHGPRIIGSVLGLHLATAVAVLGFFLDRLTGFLARAFPACSANSAAFPILVLAASAPPDAQHREAGDQHGGGDDHHAHALACGLGLPPHVLHPPVGCRS